jgi:hypothetical protein
LDITEGIPLTLGPALYRIVTPGGLASTEAFGTALTTTTLSPVGIASSSAPGDPTTVASVEVLGITTGTGGVGQVSLVRLIGPDAIAASDSTGSPQADATMSPPALAGSVAFGVAESFTSMNPNGFDAQGGGPGTAMTRPSLEPDGIASTIQAGDVDTIATVFIIPGPVDPSNDFGNAIGRTKRLIFRPPTQTLGWGWYKRFEGISVLKRNGAWEEVPWPTIDETIDAEIYLGGGRDHAVSTALAAELISEGYTISEEY